MKKALSCVLVIVLVLSQLTSITFTVSAASAAFAGTGAKSGQTGNCTWALDGTKLTISGKGAMDDYDDTDSGNNTPWGADITKVTITKGVKTIGENAFLDCKKLTSVTIPDSVTRIGYGAFSGCKGLTSVTIPNSVQTIGYGAFIGTSLTSVTIPYSVMSIDGSFRGCSSLTSVTIPDSVTTIGDDAFSNCSSLKSATIPNTVTTIGRWAFRGCSSLKSVTIPDSVTEIGEEAFSGCSCLVSAVIPEAVTEIGQYVFSDCYALKSIIVKSGNSTYDSRDNCNAIIRSDSNLLIQGCKNTVIPNTVTAIDSGAFSSCKSLKSVIIPNSVTEIGNGAFYDCSALKTVTISNTVTIIDLFVFSGCTGLTSVTIPDSVTTIGTGAFSGCSSLKSVTIPDSVKVVNDDAFYGCSSLTSLSIPDSVTAIGAGAMWGCSSLKSVTIPNSVIRIGEDAFYDCTSLTSVTVPKSVKSIKEFAFGYKIDDKRINRFTLYGYNGTAAQNYAKKNGFCFIALDQLSKPKLGKMQNAAAGVSLAWGKVTGAAKYRVFRKTASANWAKIADTTAVSYVDKTAKSGTKYAYTVRCISKDGKSYTSEYDNTGKSILYLAQPKITERGNVAKGIKLTWSKSTGAASYKVYLKNSSSWKLLATVKTNTYTYTKVKSGTTYTYTVRAVSKDGKTLSAYNTTGWSQKFIAAPAVPTLKNTKSGVQVTFKKVAGAARYRVFRKLGSGKWTKLADTTKLTLIDKTAKNGKIYYYTVRCISKDGKAYTSAYNAKGAAIKCKR